MAVNWRMQFEGRDALLSALMARVGTRDPVVAIARIDAMKTALYAASHALRSYEHGNAAGDLAREVADACDAAIAADTTHTIARLRARIDERTRDLDYVYVTWIDGAHYAVHGFKHPIALAQWLQQQAHAGRLPERIELR